MSKTVYLKIRQLTKTDKQDVYLSDVAEVYAEKKLLPKISWQHFTGLKRTGYV